VVEFEWERLVKDIERLAEAGCYEKVNRVLSLGIVGLLRERAARMAAEGAEIIADLGSGPGTSAEVIRRISPNGLILLVDPSPSMLAQARARVPGSVAFASTFEALPFGDSSVDAAVAMFSFRDAESYETALDEIARVLSPKGRLAILDFYKASNPLARALIKAYIMLLVPVGLLLHRCPVGVSAYKLFLASLDRMLTLREMLDGLRRRFQRVERYILVPGLAIFYAEGPRK